MINESIKKTFALQWIVSILVLLLLGIAVAYDLYATHRRTETMERNRLLVQARVIKVNISKQIVATYNAIQDIIADLPATLKDVNGYSHAMNLRLETIEKSIPGIRTLLLLDENGIVLSSNRPELIGDNFSFRDYFQETLRGNESGKLYLTPPFMSRLNVYIMNISCVIHGPHGEFRGVISASLDPEYFKTVLGSIIYAPDMWAYVAHSDGKLFMTAPELTAQAGKEMKVLGKFFNQHQASNNAENVYSGAFHITGDEGIVAVISIRPDDAHMSKPIVVAVHRSMPAIFTEWRRDIRIRLSGFFVTVLISIFFIRIYQARVRLSAEQSLISRQAIEESERKYRSIFENVQEVIYQTDSAGILLDISPSVNKYLGHPREELIGKPVTDYYANPDERATMLAEMSKTGEVKDYEIILRNNQYEILHISLNAHFLHDREGRRIGVEGAWRDITERKQLQELLESLAFIDGLTHLPNRRRFDEVIELEFKRAQRYNLPISLIMIDIDHFKAYNDNYGHGTGDRCLERVSKAMFECMTRAGDLLARYGGEEFVIVLPNTSINGAKHVAERLRSKIETIRIPHEYSSVASHVTISSGCATMNPYGNTTDDASSLIAEADVMLYEAKNTGRNIVCG